MFEIYYVNHNTYADEKFENVFDALAFAEKTFCVCQIKINGTAIVSWHPNTGVTWHTNEQLTTEEAASLLGLSRVRINQFCREDRFGKKFGKAWMIKIDELEKFAKVDRPTGKAKNG